MYRSLSVLSIGVTAAMRSMSAAERQKRVEQQLAKRQRIQKRINELNAQRTAFVAAKRKDMAEQAKEKTLD